jgi:LysM repeat protein
LPIENLCNCCGISTSNIYLFNDADVRHSFKKGEVLFIEPKRTKGNSCTYTVTEEITYRQLSQQLGIQLAALIRYNGDKEDRLLIKDETIALCEKEKAVNKSAYHIVSKGESLYTIAKQNNLSVSDLKIINGLSSEHLAIGQKIRLSK